MGFSSTAVAQRYHTHTYTQSDGLPSSLVWDVVQDPTGRMWFATRTGVAVYDGRDWRTYSPSDGLAHPDQKFLAVDDRGTLWSASADSRILSLFEGDRWAVLPPIPRNSDADHHTTALTAISRDDALQVAVGTENAGLMVWNGERWQNFGPTQGLPQEILALAAGQEGLLVGTATGLFLLRSGSIVPVPLEIPSPAVLGLAMETLPTGRERLWLAGETWIATRENGVLQIRRQDLRLPFPPYVRGLILEPDRQGGLFFGTGLVVGYLDAEGSLEMLDGTSGLVTQGVLGFHLDREQNLWVASGRGVTKVISLRFANYDTQHGLLDNEVTAVLERASGEMVLGHEQGLTILGPGEPRQIPLRPAGTLPNPRHRVLDLTEDPAGNLWVAGGAMGMCRIDAAGAIHWYGEAEGFAHSALVYLDRQGTLWAGTNRDLYRWSEGRFVHDSAILGIRRLFEDRQGRQYLATDSAGMFQRLPQPDAPWTPIAHLEGESAYAFLEDRQGRRWIGTGSGLFRMTDRGAERVVSKGPATGRPVYFLVEDPDGRLWIGTDNGVLRWDERELVSFTVDEGLSGRETNRAAGVVDSRGRLWIGTDQGVSVYRRAFDHPGQPPKVELRNVVAGNRPHSLTHTDAARLGPEQNDLVFHFRALSFRDERRVRFQSWLEGYEDTWLAPYTAPQQELRYTNLPPGDYRFHLRAASADGVWSDPISSAPIVIAPPFWQRPWFTLSVGLLTLMILYGVQRFFAQRRYAGQLEAEVERRTEALATLSQERAEFLAIAAHDLRVPLVNLRGFTAEVGTSLSELREALKPVLAQLSDDVRRQVDCLLQRDLPEELAFIDSSAVRMDRLVTAILQLSRLEHRELHFEKVEMESLVQTILRSLTYRLEQHPAIVEVGPLPPVVADPMAMDLVLQNLLSNAVTYLQPGRPGRIAVAGARNGTETIFEIRDNGRGIALDERDKVFQIFGRAGCQSADGEGMGLAYVRTLLRRHGGRVWFDSQPGGGTVFYFALPLATSLP